MGLAKPFHELLIRCGSPASQAVVEMADNQPPSICLGGLLERGGQHHGIHSTRNGYQDWAARRDEFNCLGPNLFEPIRH